MDARLLVGRNIARVRTAKGISQTQLAHRIDPSDRRMGQAYISMIENGRKNISILTLAIIADALSVRMSELVHQDDQGQQ